MQLATRRIFMNLCKNAIQVPSKITAPAASAWPRRNGVSHRSYSEEKPKQELLRFPAFPLKETLDRFIKSTEPLLTPEELEETKKVTAQFNDNEGAKLQKLLEGAAEKEKNWLAGRWLRVAYLQYRDPVTVFSSPGMTFPLELFRSEDDFIMHTAKIIYTLIKYKELIDNGKIPVVKMGKNELDNSQFERVFGTCRVPRVKEDGLIFHPNSKYVIVIYRHHFYKLPVYNKNNKPLHPEVLAEQLTYICLEEKCKEKGIEFGILSTDTRDNWAEAYAVLTKNPNNCQAVGYIQQSLFTVSLDERVPAKCGEEWNVQSAQLIHGGGSDQNSGNRWMDKTIQLIVNPNGMTGFTYEHSPAEGQPIALMTDYIVKNLNCEEFFEAGTRDDYECTEKLTLQSNKCLDNHIETAKRNVNNLAKNLTVNVLHYKSYGKAFLKTQKLSPDSFIQMAIQYAFYQLHEVPGAHYESAHLRIYIGGRTETIRSCSNESIAFAKAMIDTKVSNAKRAELLREAVTGHRNYTNLALQGRGVDRHLLGLKLMAIENNLPIPKFFSTPGFLKSSRFRLSTSQVASVNPAFMCYGPLTDDGYGCCYNPRECDMLFAISAWDSNIETNVNKFTSAMRRALDSMYEVLINASKNETKNAKL